MLNACVQCCRATPAFSNGAMIIFVLLSWLLVAYVATLPGGHPSVRNDLDGLMAVLESTAGIVPFEQQQQGLFRQLRPGQVDTSRTNGNIPKWCGNDDNDFKSPYRTACTVPVVVYGWNRPHYFKRVLRQLKEINDHVMSLPSWKDSQDVNALEVFVSLDGPHYGMMQAVLEYAEGIEDRNEILDGIDRGNSFPWGSSRDLGKHLKESLKRKNEAAQKRVKDARKEGSAAAVSSSNDQEMAPRPLPVRRILINPIPSSHLEEAKSLEPLKRHWWWMMKQVFSVVPELRHNEGPVLFIEDDMKLPLESMHVFRWLSGILTSSQCHDCWGGALSVGGFSEGEDPQSHPNVAYIKAGHTNSAYFFNRTTYSKMSSDAAAYHYERFPDGWDWVMAHFSHIGLIPHRAVVPALSRVHNFGVVGLTVTASEYKRLGLGDSPHSTDDAPTFLARAEKGELQVHDVKAEGESRGSFFLGPKEFSRSPEGTSSRCPVCQEDGTDKKVPRYRED
jgi:N-acetylglucosaminyltransferase II (MGAT2)